MDSKKISAIITAIIIAIILIIICVSIFLYIKLKNTDNYSKLTNMVKMVDIEGNKLNKDQIITIKIKSLEAQMSEFFDRSDEYWDENKNIRLKSMRYILTVIKHPLGKYGENFYANYNRVYEAYKSFIIEMNSDSYERKLKAYEDFKEIADVCSVMFYGIFTARMLKDSNDENIYYQRHKNVMDECKISSDVYNVLQYKYPDWFTTEHREALIDIYKELK